jgi:apolipoprotein N-acyltransferase
LAAGAAVALSLPPFGWWPLGVVGLAGLAALLEHRPARSRAVMGGATGLSQYAIGLWWVTEFNAAGYLALVLMAMATTALAALLVPARRRSGVLIGLPAALVVTDWLRGHVPFGGLPIGSAALGQAAGPLVPVARLGGALLVTGVAAAAGAALAAVALGVWPRRRPGAVAVGLLVLAAVVALVAAGRFGPDGAGPGPHPLLRVAAAQGGGPRGLRAVNSDPALPFARQLEASAAIVSPLDLLVWPEDALQVDQPIGQAPEGAVIGRLAMRLGATVIAGVVEDDGPTRFRNAAVAWAPTGVIVGRYDKVHRVPFGEYVPGRSLFQHLVNLDLVPRDAVAGDRPGILVTPGGPLGVVISYEVFFADPARSAIGAGGQVLLVPTNASSYQTSQVPTQEVAAAQLRAWETGRDTIQAAPTGYSAIIDHDGRVRVRSVLGRQQVVSGLVSLRSGQTLFVRFGDLPLLVLALVSLVLARWRGRRSQLASS